MGKSKCFANVKSDSDARVVQLDLITLICNNPACAPICLGKQVGSQPPPILQRDSPVPAVWSSAIYCSVIGALL